MQFFFLCDRVILTDPDKSGVILTGDLFMVSDLNKHGGPGDDDRVWAAFKAWFKWVVSATDHHDLFRGRSGRLLSGSPSQFRLFQSDSLEEDYLKIVGLRAIIGPKGQPWWTELHECNSMLHHLVSSNPCFCSMEGPTLLTA